MKKSKSLQKSQVSFGEDVEKPAARATSAPKAPKPQPRKFDFFCDDKFFDENLSVIKIEHCLECPIFNEKAHEVYRSITENFPKQKFKFLLNESEADGKKFSPRLGAFEISFAKNCRLTYHLIWSGIERGPPRREKFPGDIDSLVRQIRKLLVTGWAILSISNLLNFLKLFNWFQLEISTLQFSTFQ